MNWFYREKLVATPLNCSLNFASRVRTIELGKATKHAESATGTDSPGTASPSSESPTPISGSGSRARAKLSNLKSGG